MAQVSGLADIFIFWVVISGKIKVKQVWGKKQPIDQHSIENWFKTGTACDCLNVSYMILVG